MIEDRLNQDAQVIYFIDMDGVIAKYDRAAYDRNKGPEENTALFEHEPSHYFAACEPDPKGIRLLKKLSGESMAKTFILTSVAKHIPWAADDKKAWLRAHCPFIDPESQLIIAGSDKTEIAKALTMAGKLSAATVLIDDFNPNLKRWQDEGGLAIKYLNGVNSPDSWPGIKINAYG